MSHNPEFKIEAYNHSHDASLAEMWNESDKQWPSGFTHGVAMTAERVADWMDKQTTLMRLVVISPEGKVVAYGSLWDEPSQAGRSCYVDLLNVHPDFQGRSLCRRMLVQMVDRATEQGYQRMTLGTWSANLKAVPLYKKVGFNWKPNTTVSMENYIPALRQLPILRDFFAQSDWYVHHSRELLQVEDKQQHPKTGETEVYLYRWVHPDGESIEAVIDRKAQTVTGLETSAFAVYAQLGESRPAQGVRYPIRWQLSNKRSQPLSVQLRASGDRHVQIEFNAAFTLAPGETRSVTASYRCAGDAPRLHLSNWRPQPTPQIKTVLCLDEEELILGSGVHYEPAAEISLYPEPVTLFPGLAQTVQVEIKNHLKRTMQGELRIMRAEGLSTDWQTQRFTAAAEGYASLPLQLTSQREGTVALAAIASFEDAGELIQSAPQALPVLVRKVGSVAALAHHPDLSQTRLYVENDFFFAGCSQREGRFWLSDKAGTEYHLALSETLGPPFTPNEFEQKDFSLTLSQEAGIVNMRSTIASTAFPGLTLTRELIINASPLVEVRYWLENTGDRPHTCKILTSIHPPDSDDTTSLAAIPRRERLVTGLANTMPELEGDFPKYPNDLAEQWGALTRQGQVHGIVWSDEISEHEWRPWYIGLFSVEKQIAPGERASFRPIYLYSGPGDWRAVRRIWQQVHGESWHERLSNRAMPAAGEAQQVTLAPNPALTLNGNVTLHLSADHLRQKSLHGRILLTPPAGWQADQTEFALEGLQQEQSFAADIRLESSNSTLGASVGEVLLETTNYDRRQPFTILRLGDERKRVTVEQSSLAEQPLWQLENGQSSWSVAPAFHAGVVAWHELDSETNHLRSPFPADGEFAWMKPWFGGIRPILMGSEGGWPGKLHQETFRTAAIEQVDTQGLCWQGVRVQSEMHELRKFRGLAVEIDYLTLPGSNVLKCIYRLINRTPIYWGNWEPAAGFMLFTQVDGEFDKTVLYGNSPYVGEVQRKRSDDNLWVNVGNWAAVVNPQSGRALAVACPSHPESILLMDSAERGGHLWVKQIKSLEPQGVNELVVYAALVDSLEEAKRYAVLGELS